MRKLIYPILDLIEGKTATIIFLIQMIVVILLTNYSINQALDLNKSLKTLDELKATESYKIVDSTSDERIEEIFSNEAIYLPKQREFYKKLINTDCENMYSLFGYDSQDESGLTVHEKNISYGFFDTFNINAYKGRLFTKEDFFNQSDVIPIIVGYGLKDRYPLGAEYTLNTNNDISLKCEVVGILPLNTSSPSIWDASVSESLDSSLIFPITEFAIDEYYKLEDFDMAITSTIITTSDKASLNELAQWSAHEGLFSIQFVSVNDIINNYTDMVVSEITINFVVAIIILIFACAGIISHISAFITRKQRDFGVHILCGARKTDIAIRFILQIAIIMFTAFFICVLFAGFSASTLYTLLLELITIIVISVLPLFKLSRLSIPQMIKRSE
ncbi:MAG: ABC transporter permease [Oscillospiraceae bacterium]|jgi:hypothetical protein|nr:ABC transporter permease [Oscillospiraceae bacterium]